MLYRGKRVSACQNDEFNASKKNHVILSNTCKEQKKCKYWSFLDASFSHINILRLAYVHDHLSCKLVILLVRSVSFFFHKAYR